MEFNLNELLNILIKTIGVVFALFIFRKPLTSLIERTTKVNFKRKKKDSETELNLNADQNNNNDNNEENFINNTDITTDEKNDELKVDHTQILDLLKNGNFEKAEELYNKLVLEEKGKDEKIFLERYYLYYSYNFQKDVTFDKIIEFGNRFKENNIVEYARTLYNIGNLNLYFDKFDEAEKYFNKCYDLELPQLLFSNIVVSHSELINSPSDSLDFLLSKLVEVSDKDAIYNILYRMYKILDKKNDSRADLILEKASNYTREKLFDVAHGHNDDVISAYIYSNILKSTPTNQAALNNIGVAYEALKLNILSVNSYKKSYENGNSLAGANLANKLINNGFIDEGKEYIEKEKSKEGYHENIDHHSSRIHKRIKEENDQVNDMFSSAKVKINFMDKNAISFLKKIDHIFINSKYSNDEIDLTINSTENDSFEIVLEENTTVYKTVNSIKYYGIKITLMPETYVYNNKYSDVWIVFNEEINKIHLLTKNNNDYRVLNLIKEV